MAHHSPAASSRAIVIGAGISGLLAARVLADYFAEVIVIERDTLPEHAGPRKGVPQARHVHQLLARGIRVLDQLFPGFSTDLRAHGAVPINFPNDLAWHMPAGQALRFPSNLNSFACSRDLLEFVVRRRLRRYQQVRMLPGHDVVGLIAGNGGRHVAGVVARPRGEHSQGAEQELHAALVVDASGRSSRAPEWLGALGFPAPEETVVNSYLGYASRVYAPPAGQQYDWKILTVTSTPPETRSAVLLPLEGGRWFLTLSGYARDYPPTDEVGFLEFTRSLAHPAIYDAIQHATPLGPIAGYQRTENRIRHYERLKRWPEGFVLVGDAVCSFNPVYGQGMTNGALAAQLLHTRLGAARRHGMAGFGRDFQRRLARQNEIAWTMSTSVDFRFPTTEGVAPRTLPAIERYNDRVFAMTTCDPVVATTFYEVTQMLRPPTAFFQPNVVLRVLSWNGKIARPAPAPQPAPHAELV